MNYNTLSKDVLSIIRPPIWDSYYYVSISLRKVFEKKVGAYLESEKKYDVLDYGCGNKPYQYLFANNVNRYVGVDIGDNIYADYKIAPGKNLDFDDAQFDIILSSQVLEHVENTDHYMKECQRLLKSNGLLFLSTHGTWQYHSSPTDYYRWTSLGLKKLIEKYSFEIIDFAPILGQLAVTSQLRLSFYHSFAEMVGSVGKILLLPISILYQFKMMAEDFLTPKRVKERDSAIYLVIARKRT